jgi:hypothetical protein
MLGIVVVIVLANVGGCGIIQGHLHSRYLSSASWLCDASSLHHPHRASIFTAFQETAQARTYRFACLHGLVLEVNGLEPAQLHDAVEEVKDAAANVDDLQEENLS